MVDGLAVVSWSDRSACGCIGSWFNCGWLVSRFSLRLYWLMVQLWLVGLTVQLEVALVVDGLAVVGWFDSSVCGCIG